MPIEKLGALKRVGGVDDSLYLTAVQCINSISWTLTGANRRNKRERTEIFHLCLDVWITGIKINFEQRGKTIACSNMQVITGYAKWCWIEQLLHVSLAWVADYKMWMSTKILVRNYAEIGLNGHLDTFTDRQPVALMCRSCVYQWTALLTPAQWGKFRR